MDHLLSKEIYVYQSHVGTQLVDSDTLYRIPARGGNKLNGDFLTTLQL